MEAGATQKEPRATEAKSGGEGPSMEEILQSIRRIIADDDNEGKKSVSDTRNGKSKAQDSEIPGSDMLELTDMLKDDGTVVDMKKDASAGAARPAAGEPAAGSFDILSQIDQALENEKPSPATAPAAVMPEAAPPATSAAPAAPAAPTAPTASAAPSAPAADDSLLSESAAAATAEAFSRLKSMEPLPSHAVAGAVPSFRSGATIEDMVGDMLRPMLKSWLDANLPQTVERIVEREVRKLTR